MKTVLHTAALALALAVFAAACDTADVEHAHDDNHDHGAELEHNHAAEPALQDSHDGHDHAAESGDHGDEDDTLGHDNDDHAGESTSPDSHDGHEHGDGDEHEHGSESAGDAARHGEDMDHDTHTVAELGDTENHDEHEHATETAAYTDDPAMHDDHAADEQMEDEHAGHDHGDEGRVTSGGDWETLVGLETVHAETRDIDLLLNVPGRIVPDRDRVAVVTPFIESSVNRVFVNVGDMVSPGDLLVCLTSPEVGMLRAEYERAEAELDIRTRAWERQKRLAGENIVSEKALQNAELDRRTAEVAFNYARNRLLATGIPAEHIDTPPEGHSDAVGSTIHISSPINGIVTAREATVGEKVGTASRLLEVMNLDTVWVEADVFEKDLTQVAIGRTVRITVAAYPGETFSGRIFHIGGTLDPDTRTITIIAELANHGHRLKPGMFARTGIVVGERKNALVVPEEAILTDETLEIVFVREGESYHRHEVETGIESGGFVEIVRGLEPGAEVVTRGNFQLKSKLNMAGADPHAGHNH